MKLVVDPLTGMPVMQAETVMQGDTWVSGGSVGSSATGVKTIVAGTNITINNTDPANPIISAASGSSGISEELAIAYAIAL